MNHLFGRNTVASSLEHRLICEKQSLVEEEEGVFGTGRFISCLDAGEPLRNLGEESMQKQFSAHMVRTPRKVFKALFGHYHNWYAADFADHLQSASQRDSSQATSIVDRR
jgi:hypothetical protein